MQSNSIPLHSVHSLLHGVGPGSSSNHAYYAQQASSSSSPTTAHAPTVPAPYQRGSMSHVPPSNGHLKRDLDPPAAGSSGSGSGARPVKRSRKAINCEPCRSSKLKCDRGKPCSGCVLRGTVSSCYPDSQSTQTDDPNDTIDEYLPNPRVDPRAELTRIRNSLLVLEQTIARSAGISPGDTYGGSARRMLGERGSSGGARLPDDPPPKPNEGGIFIGATSIACTLLSLRLQDSDEESSDEETDGQAPPSSDGAISGNAGISDIRSHNPFNQAATGPSTSIAAHVDDLLEALPDAQEIDALIDNYFVNGIWLHRHIHEPTFRANWAKFKASDEMSSQGGGAIILATVFEIIAISLQYLVPTHPIFQHLQLSDDVTHTTTTPSSSTHSRNQSQSPPMSAHEQLHSQTQIQVALGAHYFNLAEMAYNRHIAETKALSMTLVEYLLLKVHYLNIRKEDCEQIWEVRGMLVSLGTAMGLHRDPGKWKMPDGEVERRRWAWWNILQTDRWQAFLFGRPAGIANHHFDTRFPMEEPSPSSDSVSQITIQSNPLLAYLQFFRLVHLMGDIMDDATSVRPVSHDRIMQHDRALDHLLRTLPPDMDLDDVYIARSLAANNPLESKRLAAQSIVHRSALHHVRFTLHRPFVTGKTSLSVPSAARQASLDIATNAASALIQVVTQSSPDYCKPNSLGVPGHLSWGSFHAFAAAMFFAFQIIWNGDRPDDEPLPGAGIFRENIRRVQRALNGVRGQVTLASKAYTVLEALKPLWEDPESGGGFHGVTDEKRKLEVWAQARKLAFPCHDSPLHVTKGGLGTVAGSTSSESPPASGVIDGYDRRSNVASPPAFMRRSTLSNIEMNGGSNFDQPPTPSSHTFPRNQSMPLEAQGFSNGNGGGGGSNHRSPASYYLSHTAPTNSMQPNGNIMIAPPPLTSIDSNGSIVTGQAHYQHSPTGVQPNGGYFDMGLGMGMGMNFPMTGTSSEESLWPASLGLYQHQSNIPQGVVSGNTGESWASSYKFVRD
ncbi:hypothetical protein FRB95_013834 [Tulasnella sp. JGI-2019a]|nr:hypothetical protein FRB95_013834 [Tulasnella sp. JGI-2019a]